MILFNNKRRNHNVSHISVEDGKEVPAMGDMEMIADQLMDAFKSGSKEALMDALEAFKSHIMAEDMEQDEEMMR